MSNIQENLQKILSAVWGRDVRQAIHDAIHDCYEDGSAGTTDLIARERLDDLEESSATKTELQTESTARSDADQGILDTIGDTSMGTTAETITGAIRELWDRQVNLAEMRNWKLIQDADIQGGTTVQIPDDAREIYVLVFAKWSSVEKVCVGFLLPIAVHLFNPTGGATTTYHSKVWEYNVPPSEVGGFVVLKTTRDNLHYYVELNKAYDQSNSNVLNSTYCRIYWR